MNVVPIEKEINGDEVAMPYDQVSSIIEKGKSFGVVGESGSGKTSLGRAILRLIDCKSGEVSFDGGDVGGLKRGEMNPEEARELLLFVAQYSGYPRAAAMLGPTEEAIAEFHSDTAQDATPDT